MQPERLVMQATPDDIATCTSLKLLDQFLFGAHQRTFGVPHLYLQPSNSPKEIATA